MFYEIPANIYGDPQLLYGKRVVVNSSFVPKMQLSKDVPVSDDFREEINQWMIEFFGMDYLIPTNQILMVGDSFVMNPEAYAVFQRKISPFMEINNGHR